MTNVDARETHRLIEEMVEEGYARSFLATRLGLKNKALQFYASRITVRNAARILRLYAELMS